MPSGRTFARLRGWRPGLRAAVLAGSALVVVGVAMGIAVSTADHIRDSSILAARRNAESIVRTYLDPILQAGDLDIGAVPDPDVGVQLSRLVAAGDMKRINIWTRDGRVLYSTEPTIQGMQLGIDENLATAFSGQAADEFATPGQAAGGAGVLPPRVVELYVPIRGMSDANPIGVFEVYLDARPIEQRVDDTRRDVFLITLGGGAVLLVLLWLGFGTASRLLASQNRRLGDLARDLRGREARFRSLVQNSSDVVLVIGPDGRITYESDAVRRILGHDPMDDVGRGFEHRVHPDEASRVRAMLDGLAADRNRSQQTTEMRLRHADGSWRWVEAIGQNLSDDAAVGGVVLNFRDVTDRKQLEEQLQHEAFHDPLTGLANRALFADRVTHALARSVRGRADRLGVLFIDLDDFKVVNDSLGHQAGDELLTAVGERIRACLRRQDTAARLGGDEFGILVEEADPGLAEQLAERILAALRQPFGLAARQLFVQASIGIAMSADGPDGVVGESAQELLRNADAAMYVAKSRGKGRHEFYEARMHATALRRLELRERLEGALRERDLVVHYQPVVELDGGAIAGAEALVRWRQPDGRLALPGEFIPLAEETGLVVPLGTHVMEAACRDAATWPAAPSGQPRTVSVNVASRQLQEPAFNETVRDILRRTGLDAERLVVEVTESALLDDGEETSRAIAEIKRMGVKVALDDFGTGYSSLSHLRRFPIDALKIDRSFVDGIDGDEEGERALVRSIVRLAHSLKLETVAEGVERAQQVVRLRAIGARYGQGFHFAKPMEVSAFRRLLAGSQLLAG